MNCAVLDVCFIPRSYWQLNHYSVTLVRREKIKEKERGGGRHGGSGNLLLLSWTGLFFKEPGIEDIAAHVISLFFSTPFPSTLAKLLPRDNKLLQQENTARRGQIVSIILKSPLQLAWDRSKGVVLSTVYQLDIWLAEAWPQNWIRKQFMTTPPSNFVFVGV